MIFPLRKLFITAKQHKQNDNIYDPISPKQYVEFIDSFLNTRICWSILRIETLYFEINVRMTINTIAFYLNNS